MVEDMLSREFAVNENDVIGVTVGVLGTISRSLHLGILILIARMTRSRDLVAFFF
jgi:hypothetical protein